MAIRHDWALTATYFNPAIQLRDIFLIVVILDHYDYLFTRYRASGTRSGCANEQIEFFGKEAAALTKFRGIFDEQMFLFISFGFRQYDVQDLVTWYLPKSANFYLSKSFIRTCFTENNIKICFARNILWTFSNVLFSIVFMRKRKRFYARDGLKARSSETLRIKWFCVNPIELSN